MAKRNRRSFEKFQKEIKRKKTAKEKMDRRQGRNTEEEEAVGGSQPVPPLGQDGPETAPDSEELRPEVEAPPVVDEAKRDEP